jgi:CRISPR-associated endonuclease/helicase Cas3
LIRWGGRVVVRQTGNRSDSHLHTSTEKPITKMNFPEFFKSATGYAPYDYQVRIACGKTADSTKSEYLVTGTECVSRIISIPTGLGKTAAVTIAWLWNRIALSDEKWPRRLVYCLPMRTLVEQTVNEIEGWLDNLTNNSPEIPNDYLIWLGDHSPVVLMGGEENDISRREWDIFPEKPAVLVGTQDMLLSRALNRGYGMTRTRWPMPFGLLNNDVLWVMDETQLMGPGLWTSSQLDWLRQERFKTLRSCFTWWMSATIDASFLATKDRTAAQGKLPEPGDAIEITPAEAASLAILGAQRPFKWWGPQKKLAPRKRGTRKAQETNSRDIYLAALGEAVLNEHLDGSLSLVVCNNVATAQKLFENLTSITPVSSSASGNIILLTSRFRPIDRNRQLNALLAFENARKNAIKKNSPIAHPGLICVSTQVVEAGVDISARRLWSELAPWPSTLQRLGRLNRDGRLNGEAIAFAFEPPPEKSKSGKKSEPFGPYMDADLADAKKIITALAEECDAEATKPIREIIEQIRARPEPGKLIEKALRAKPEPFPRAFDVHGLFSTEPDAFGGFTDVSPWIRSNDVNADATVFWRDWDANKAGPPNAQEYSGPAFQREEGCPVAVYRLRKFVDLTKASTFLWDDKTCKWENVRANDICPGMVVLLPASAGGYAETFGWTGNKQSRFASRLPPPGPFDAETDENDRLTELKKHWVALDQHLSAVAVEAEHIGKALMLSESLLKAISHAAFLHDIGKSWPQWQDALPQQRPDVKTLWAKAPSFCKRVGMRHEAASAMAAWYGYYRTNSAYFTALTIYLVGAHHGIVRTVLASRTNAPQPNVCGIPVTITPQELPWRPNPTDTWMLDFSCALDGTDGTFAKDATGKDIFISAAPGWTALVADLLGGWEADASPVAAGAVPMSEPHSLNPFNLAFLETILRAADWRVSAQETGLSADQSNL